MLQYLILLTQNQIKCNIYNNETKNKNNNEKEKEKENGKRKRKRKLKRKQVKRLCGEKSKEIIHSNHFH